MALVAWFAGLVALLAAAAVASARARARPSDVTGRAAFAALAALASALAAGTVWCWGGQLATDGRAGRIHDGALVDLQLASLDVTLDAPLTLGHDASADLRVAGAPTLARIARDAHGLVVTPLASTVAISNAARDGRCVPASAPFALPAGAAVVVEDCAHPGAAYRIANGATVAIANGATVRITMLGAARIHTLARAGDVLRLGRTDAPVPGLVTWELPAPAGTTEVLALPADPSTCAGWAAGPAGTCEVTAGAFTLHAVPLVPAAGAILDRDLRAVLVLGAPLVLACLVLVASPRSRRRIGALSHLARVASLTVLVAAIACWRLVWAYRIDLLRDVAPLGPRLAENQLAVALLGATLAGLALGARRARIAILAWLAWLPVAWLVLGLAAPALTLAHAGAAALSLAATLLPHASRRSARWSAAASRLVTSAAPEIALAAIAVAAVASRFVAPRGVLAKLALAYALVLAGHAALCALVRPATLGRRVRLVAALLAAVAALAAYDTGVTVAIAGVGIAVALLVAGHDAVYDASSAPRLGVLEREHARLIWLQGIVTIGAALGALAAVAIADRHEWLARGTAIVSAAPLVAAALFACATVLARLHRRPWWPHAAAMIAAIALWGARGDMLARAMADHGVASDRLSAVIEPGYALLRDDHRFAATASAWREAALPRTADGVAIDTLHGQGLLGARITDPGVIHSVENDYLAVLVARDAGIAGIAQTTLLLLVLVAGAGALASIRLRHASRAHRARWLVAMVAGTLCIYQPLAALGVLPLTGISWPGLGIDSPADLWLVMIGAVWCYVAGDEQHATDDERVRMTPRVARARRIALGALVLAALAGGAVVARSAAAALERVPGDDDRIDAAIRYAGSLACPWPERDGSLADVIPLALAGKPTDAGTTRFDRELAAAWHAERTTLAAALPSCSGRIGHWRLARAGDTCTATFRAGWPAVRLALARTTTGTWHARCAISADETALAALRARPASTRGQRIRVVAEPLGAVAADAGELLVGGRVIRLRPGAPASTLAEPAARAGKVVLAAGVTIEVTAPHRIVLHGDAELFVAEPGPPTAWRHVTHAREAELARISLVVVGPAQHRELVLVRPSAAPLLADDVDRAHRTYPYGSALPELGWVNPFDVDHSLGLDGWIHAALAHPAAPAAACGLLQPPAIDRARICATSALDGVTECRVALQPELAASLRALADQLATDPHALTGRASTPTRIGYVVLRGDTGELLAQSSIVPGRAPLAYAPADAAAEAALIALREQPGEADAERVEWNLPIAIGSTFKPVVARAAEQTFPDELAKLTLEDSGTAGAQNRCKRRGQPPFAPLLGHCPPTTLASEPAVADLHDFLAHSPNWFQAAIGVVGLGLPGGTFAAGTTPVTFDDIARSDLAAWPTDTPLTVSDAHGTIVGAHALSIDGLRRTPLWQHVEQLLGRPLCTLGDHASCLRAAERADTCAARALPIATPSRDLRYLVALGPDRFDLYGDDRPQQTTTPVREYFQLLRGSGVHAIGSLAQLTDAFGRIVFDPTNRLAASWFPAPAVGVTPAYACGTAAAPANTVLGAGGGLCAVVEPTGTTHGALATILADPTFVVYGAKTGTIDSLAEIAHRPAACAAWNASHAPAAQLACGKTPADDSLFVIAFGIVTPQGTIPITLGLHLQRGGLGAAAHAAPAFMRAIARYFTS